MNTERKINILHLLSSYPGSNTTNWLYNLIINTPHTHAIIASEYFTKHNFYSTEFTYIESPTATINHHKKQLPTWSKYFFEKAYCYITEKIVGGLKKQVDRRLPQLNVDIAHAHFADLACHYVDFIHKKNIPLVVSFYGYDYEYLPFIKPIYINKYKELFLKADKFICEGSHGASILKKMGCVPEKIEVISLGVEVEKIPMPVRIKETAKLRLVQIASLREKKGHIYSLRSFHQALQTCPNMHLTFVGSGEDSIYKEMQQFIVQHQLNDYVTIINEIDFNKLHQFLSHFDVFLHPSCYSHDMDCEGGAPVVLLDAQACGMPVISTTHCDIPDEVIHETTGLLTPEKNSEALSKSITRFYEMNNVEYQKFSIAARKHMEANYSIKKNAIKLREVYSSLILKNK